MASLLVTLVFVLAAVSFSHLGVSGSLANRSQAENLAESAVHKAISEILRDPEWAGSAEALFPGLDGRARLSFDPDQARSWGIPVSTNNLGKDAAARGAGGQVVPAEGAHLVGVAECNGVTRRLDVILHVPTFRSAVANSGPIYSDGSLWVASADSPSALLPDILAAKDKLEPSSIASGSSDPLALELDVRDSRRSIYINGDAVARGGIAVRNPDGAPLAVVAGQQKAYSEPPPMPDIQASDYDPGEAGQPLEDGTFDSTQALALEGMVRRTGDLVLYDDLELKGALMFVEGSLTVHGTVKGTGAVITTGDLTILSAGNGVTADNVAALVADGDLTVKGSAMLGSRFQGLLYSRGQIELEDVTLFGTLVGNSPDGQRMRLTDAGGVVVPNLLGFEFDLPLGDLGLGLDPGALDALYDPVTNTFDASRATLGMIGYKKKTGLLWATTDRLTYWLWRQLLDGRLYTEAQRLAEEQAMLDKLVSDGIPMLNRLWAKTGDPSLKKGKFRMDPNLFVAFKDKVRVVSWRMR